MCDKIVISKKEYLEVLKLLDTMVCILDRSEKREDVDNRAYSLAIACAEYNILDKLVNARYLMSKLITRKELIELDDVGAFDYEMPEMPYNSSLDELRERLKPFLVKYKKYSQ